MTTTHRWSVPFVSILGGRLGRGTGEPHWTWADERSTPELRVFDLTEEQAQKLGPCTADSIQFLDDAVHPRGARNCMVAPEYRSPLFPGGVAGAWWCVADEPEILKRAFRLGWILERGSTDEDTWLRSPDRVRPSAVTGQLRPGGSPAERADRRRCQRVPVTAFATVETEDIVDWSNQILGTVADISRTGIAIRIAAEARVGQRFRVRVAIGERIYELAAQVTRVQSRKGALREVGLNWSRYARAERAVLNEFLTDMTHLSRTP